MSFTAKAPAPYQTHEVVNQAPPLYPHDLFSENRPLVAALGREGGGWAAGQVAAAVRVCAAHGIPFVARGAGTGLSGGALPVADGVVISLQRLRRAQAWMDVTLV